MFDDLPTFLIEEKLGVEVFHGDHESEGGGNCQKWGFPTLEGFDGLISGDVGRYNWVIAPSFFSVFLMCFVVLRAVGVVASTGLQAVAYIARLIDYVDYFKASLARQGPAFRRLFSWPSPYYFVEYSEQADVVQSMLCIGVTWACSTEYLCPL